VIGCTQVVAPTQLALQQQLGTARKLTNLL
jgi:hypothetical protein